MTAKRNMNPKGGLFHFFQSENQRLRNETALESIFYSNRHNSLQYKINDFERGTLTVLFSERQNDFWWQKALEDGEKRKKNGLGEHLGCIECFFEPDYVNILLYREEAVNFVPPLVNRLINDYHTKRELLGFESHDTDHYVIENLMKEKPEEREETIKE